MEIGSLRSVNNSFEITPLNSETWNLRLILHSRSIVKVLERITYDWEKQSVSWNNQPTTTSENSVILYQSSAYNENYIDIDITEMVKDMATNQDDNFGFMLKLATESYYRCLLFASSDHVNPELHPKLIIKYE